MSPYDKNYEKNINLINFKLDYPMERELFIGDSIMLKGTSDYPWTYISLDRAEELERVMGHLRPQDTRIMVQDDLVLSYLKAHYQISGLMTCTKLIYEGPPISNKEEVFELKPSDAEFIQALNDYGDYTDVAYIKKRVEKGIGLGIKVENKLLAWVLTHNDGAIGFMKVLEPYRKKGLAKRLTHEVIRRQQKLKTLSFVHIEADNEKSLSLAQQVGFKAYGKVHWLKLVKKRDLPSGGFGLLYVT